MRFVESRRGDDEEDDAPVHQKCESCQDARSDSPFHRCFVARVSLQLFHLISRGKQRQRQQVFFSSPIRHCSLLARCICTETPNNKTLRFQSEPRLWAFRVFHDEYGCRPQAIENSTRINVLWKLYCLYCPNEANIYWKRLMNRLTIAVTFTDRKWRGIYLLEHLEHRKASVIDGSPICGKFFFNLHSLRLKMFMNMMWAYLRTRLLDSCLLSLSPSCAFIIIIPIAIIQ